MFIVDSQVHIWKEETPDRPWVPGARERIRLNGHREEAFLYEECLELMDDAGVDRVIIVPPSWEGDRIDYSLEAAEAHPDRFGIMARVPQNKPDEGRALMREFAGIDAIKGIRLTFHRPIDRNWMIDGTCDWIWPYAEELGIKIMVHAPIWKAELGQIADRHPGLNIIIDHMGIMARCVDDAIGYWVQETADLHPHPNISVKVSALPGYSTAPFPNENIFPYVREMIEKMGPERCHWGTDITRLLGHGLTWKDTIEQFTVHMGLTEAQLDEVMGKSLCRVLDWPVPRFRRSLMPDTIDGGEALLEAFRALEIEHVFSSPGSEWAPAWEAFARQRRDGTDGPSYHDLTHETLAVAMATGYWLAKRRLAAVLLHTVPGLLQGGNAIHGALLAGAPMLVASSESTTYGEGDGPDPGSQWYRNLSFVGGPHTVAAPFTKWAGHLPDVTTLYESVLRAGELAVRQPSGPVYLNVGLEALLAPWQPPKVRKKVAPSGARLSPSSEIEPVAVRLAEAKNPVILTESAGRDPDAFRALVGLAELLAIPVIEPQSAICANFPKDHPLHVGGDVSLAAGADLVLLVGCRSPWYPPSNDLAPDAHVVVIDEVPQRPHIVYQVLHADTYLEGGVASTLQALAEAAPRKLDTSLVAERELRWGDVHDSQRAEADADEAKAAQNTERITPPLLVQVLREELAQDTIFVDETITHSRIVQRHLRWNEPDSWFYVQGGLGQGTGVALGVKLARPQQPVAFLVGDGSFLYNPIVQALMAAKDMALPLLIVIFNNRQYLSMKFNHLRFYPDGAAVAGNDFDGVDLSTQPPLSEFGGPFGIPGWEVSAPAQLREAVREARDTVASGSTAIVNVTFGR